MKYYNFSSLPVMDVIEQWGLEYNFPLCNAFKYCARAGKKEDEQSDLNKAVYYLEEYLKKIKSGTWRDRNYYSSDTLTVQRVAREWNGYIKPELLEAIREILYSQYSAREKKINHISEAIRNINRLIRNV